MILTRTPNRVSLFGGGSDYPIYYNQYGGMVVGFAINKYSWLTVGKNSPFLDFKTHLSYSKTERVSDHKDIEHNVIRTVLEYLKIKDGVVIQHNSDLPSRTGLGSSSTFTVGLLHSLLTLKDERVSKPILADHAIYVEQNLLNENVGSQDQTFAAYGGINTIHFQHKDYGIVVNPIPLKKTDIQYLQERMLLIFTGISRTASDIAKGYMELDERKIKVFDRMKGMAAAGAFWLEECNIEKLGGLLNEGWAEKKSIAPNITNTHIDDMHSKIMSMGAYGVKLLGAGAGGFLLALAPPQTITAIQHEFKPYQCVNFEIDLVGSHIEHIGY
jgi:D-glycero-alpha-D-manno-heptose-7-phosphate kinase